MRDRGSDAADDFEWIDATRPRGRAAGSGITLSLVKHNRTKSTLLAIVIQKDVMKRMGWVVGDRAVIGVSGSGRKVAIRRVQNGGYNLSPRGKSRRSGALDATIVRIRLPEGLKIQGATRIPMSRVEFRSDMVVVDLDGHGNPQEETE